MKTLRSAIVVAGVSISLLAGCGSSEKVSKVTEVENSAESKTAESMTAESGDAEGITVTADDGTYSVVFPAKPSPVSLDQPSPAGTVKVNMNQYVEPSGAQFVSSVSKIPGNQPAGNDEATLKAATAAVMQGMGATETSSESVTIDGFPGLRYEFTIAPNGVGFGVMVEGDVNRYQAIAVVTEEGDSKRASAFVDSLKILKDS